MLNLKYIKKAIIGTTLVFAMPYAFGAFTFTGTVEKNSKKNKYSLSNINFYAKKSLNFSLLKTSSTYTQSTIINQTPSFQGITLNTEMQFRRGNTTYIIPYKLKLKAPKFKLPTQTITH